MFSLFNNGNKNVFILNRPDLKEQSHHRVEKNSGGMKKDPNEWRKENESFKFKLLLISTEFIRKRIFYFLVEHFYHKTSHYHDNWNRYYDYRLVTKNSKYDIRGLQMWKSVEMKRFS